jgi:hypothetical protein
LMPGVAAVEGVVAVGAEDTGADSGDFATTLLAAGAATFFAAGLAAGFAAGLAAAFAGAAFFAAGLAAGFAAAFAGAAFFAAGLAAGFAAAFAGAAFFAAGLATGFAAAFAGAAFFAAGLAAGFAAAFAGAAFLAAGLAAAFTGAAFLAAGLAAAGLLGALAFFAPFFASASAMTTLLQVKGIDSTSAPPVAEGPLARNHASRAPRRTLFDTCMHRACISRIQDPQNIPTAPRSGCQVCDRMQPEAAYDIQKD